MQNEQNQGYWNPTETTEISGPTQAEAHAEGPVTWQASEYIHKEKSGLWFLALVVVAVLLFILDVFFVKSWTFGALIIIMTMAVFVLGRRAPRTLHYSLSAQGLTVDDKHFSLHDFRAFGIVEEEALYSARLIPNRRFMPLVTVYFPEELGEQIVDTLGSMLPMEHLELDFMDRLTERIRF
jgi:hypothetical protein